MPEQIEDRLTTVERKLAAIKKALIENQIIPASESAPDGANSPGLAKAKELYADVLRQFKALRFISSAVDTPLLNEIQGHLDAVRIEAALSSFDLLRERVADTGQAESPESLQFRAALLSLQSAIGDFSPNLITGDTDKLPGDMTDGVTDPNNPGGDKWPI